MNDYRVRAGVVERYRESLDDSQMVGWFPVHPDEMVSALIELVARLERDIANLKQHHPFNPNFW